MRRIGAYIGLVVLTAQACEQSPYQGAGSAWQEQQQQAAMQVDALERGQLVPNGGPAVAVTVPRLNQFAFDMGAGAYPVGQVLRLTDLYLTGHPTKCRNFYFVSDVLPRDRGYVPLGDCTRAPIITSTQGARLVVEATPRMGAQLQPGYSKIYEVEELIGVVQPLPGEPDRRTLVVTRLSIEGNVIAYPSWN